MSYLNFSKDHASPSGKTFVWTIHNTSSGIPLGEVKWFAPWRKYTFCPFAATTWDNACLTEILVFVAKANDDREGL